MKAATSLALGLFCLLSVGALVRAQNPGLPEEPPDITAYRPIYAPSSSAIEKAERAEAFLAETSAVFINSPYRDNVFLILFQSYMQQKNWKKVLETVDRMEQLVPKTPREKQALFYQEAMRIAATELNDTKKAAEYADKIRAIDPGNAKDFRMPAPIARPPETAPAQARVGVIAGRLLHADGTPAVAADVVAVTPTRQGQASLEAGHVSAFARTNGEGHYRLESLAPGSYVLAAGAIREAGNPRVPAPTITKPAYLPNPVTVSAGVTVERDFTLPAEPPPVFPGHRVSGVVSGAMTTAKSADGALRFAPAPVVVFFRGLECGVGESDFSAAIAPDGAYEIRDLTPGAYSACLGHAANSSGHFGPLDFAVGDRNVSADLTFAEGPRSTGQSRQIRLVARPIGARGIATLPGLEAGKTIQGQVLSGVPAAAQDSNRTLGGRGGPGIPGANSTAVIYLVPIDSSGAPMRALLTLPTSLDPPANGAFEIDNVPHGRYNLFATIHDPGSSIRGETGPVSVGRIPISIEGFELGFLSINVLRGVAVNGRVTQNGRPLSNGVALMLEPDMSVAGMLPYQDVARVRPMIAPDGAFTFPQVPEGHYNVRAGIAGQPTASVRVIHDGKDITDSGLDVGDTPPLPIEIEFR